MSATEYVRALRRRWLVVVICTLLVGGAAAWLTLTAEATKDNDAEGPYKASAVLVGGGASSAPGVTSLSTVGSLGEIEAIQMRVAEAIGFDGLPQKLADMVEVASFPESGILVVSATANNPDKAKLIADTWVSELLGFFGTQKAKSDRQQEKSLEKRLDRLEAGVQELDEQIPAASVTDAQVLTAERDALLREYGVLFEQYRQLTESAGRDLGFTLIQDAVPVEQPPQALPGGFQLPRSDAVRIVLAALLGLLVGVGLVLFLERFDSRIRTKEAAERHFALPVLAEIPVAPKRRQRPITVATDPRSLTAAAYRLLAAALTRRTRSNNTQTNGLGKPGRVILVTSPDSGEGKTTVVANLAATFAEQGQRVLVLSCDFRAPRIHDLFGVQGDPGLVEAIGSHRDGPVLNGTVEDTSIEGVRLVPSGSAVENPGSILSSTQMTKALQEARRAADVVLLDTAPILSASESSVLFSQVDGVLMVARSGRTTAALAERTSELFTGIDTPALGVVLVAAAETALPHRSGPSKMAGPPSSGNETVPGDHSNGGVEGSPPPPPPQEQADVDAPSDLQVTTDDDAAQPREDDEQSRGREETRVSGELP